MKGLQTKVTFCTWWPKRGSMVETECRFKTRGRGGDPAERRLSKDSPRDRILVGTDSSSRRLVQDGESWIVNRCAASAAQCRVDTIGRRSQNTRWTHQGPTNQTARLNQTAEDCGRPRKSKTSSNSDRKALTLVWTLTIKVKSTCEENGCNNQ